MVVNTPYYWNDYLKKGDELFQYMTCNFESMFDGDETIKHFDIREGIYQLIYEAKEIFHKDIKILYENELQKELITWIKEEFKKNKLFEKSLWKPFRDQNIPTRMYLGYRKIFGFKGYYFQLALEKRCGICKYCKMKENTIHFELALWGWNDDTSEFFLSYNEVTNLSNNIMPEQYWQWY